MKKLTLLLAVLFLAATFSTTIFAQAKQLKDNYKTSKLSMKLDKQADRQWQKEISQPDPTSCIPCYNKIQALREKYQPVATNICQNLVFTVYCCMQGQPITVILTIRPNSFLCNGNEDQ